LSETSLVELVIEWVVGFCVFCWVLRCGPNFDFFVNFGLLIKDSTFIIWNFFLRHYLMYLSFFWLVLSRSEVSTREMVFLKYCLAC